jgi:hypothetical protein
MRVVMVSLLVTAIALWYAAQRNRVRRAREYSKAATERWENEGGKARAAAGTAGAADQPLDGDRAMMS